MSSFWIWWQQLPMKIDPVVFEIGWLKVHYYGLMYIVACAVTYAIVRHRLKHEGRFAISVDHVNNLMTYMLIGVIVGGRLGYSTEDKFGVGLSFIRGAEAGPEGDFLSVFDVDLTLTPVSGLIRSNHD